MTLEEYTGAIVSVATTKISKAKIVVEIFDAGKSFKIVSEDTANRWLSGSRNCQIRRYFPDAKINNTEGIYKYFRNRKEAFLIDLKKTFRQINTDKIVKCDTDDMDEFCWSIVNQFAALFDLQWPDQPTTNAPIARVPSTSPIVPNKMSSKQMCAEFVEIIEERKIMRIINRKPPIMRRNDSTTLNVFVNHIEKILIKPNENNKRCIAYADIYRFYEILRIEALSIEANLNWRFDYEDASASIDLDKGGSPIEPKRASGLADIPELTKELILESDDPLGLLEMEIREWGNSRDELNYLYNRIRERAE